MGEGLFSKFFRGKGKGKAKPSEPDMEEADTGEFERPTNRSGVVSGETKPLEVKSTPPVLGVHEDSVKIE